MRTQLRIRTEADYLQAHLTVIEEESRGRNLTLRNVKQRVTSVLKKWILAANANSQRRLPSPPKALIFRMVGYSEVILGRDLLAGKLEICWGIPALQMNHRIAGRPPPDKSSYRNLALAGRQGSFPHSDNPVYRDLSTLRLVTQ